MRRQLICLTICYLAGVTTVQGADAPGSGQREFAVRFGSSAGSCLGKKKGSCVVGRLPRGKRLFLLEANGPRICPARAAETFMAGWEAGEDFALTRIDSGNCPKFDYRLAVISGLSPRYDVVTNTGKASEEAARIVDASVRQGISGIVPESTEHPTELSRRAPRVFRLPSQSPNSFIAVYENARIPGDQTHVLVSNGQLKLIHSAANVKAIFALGTRHFIHYAFTCKIGCGWGGDIVVEFTNADFSIVMFEDAGST